MEGLREQWLILISMPVYILIIGLELVLTHLQHKKAYTLKDTLNNVYLTLLNAGLDVCFRVVSLGILGYFFQHAIMRTWTHPAVYWVMLLLAEDFMYYWLHRFDHEIRLFWAVHVTHHSSKHLNFTIGFRSSVFEPLYRFIYFIPLAWVGFKPLDIFFMYSATQIWGTLVHTELINKLGWLEYILVTPSHHRVHHASNPKYLDKNMGMFLIVWDKIFGTFQAELPAESYQPIKYGLTTDLEDTSPGNLVFHEWRQMMKDVNQEDLTIQEKIGYVLGPPGWSHDGSRMTSEEMRAAEEGQMPVSRGAIS